MPPDSLARIAPLRTAHPDLAIRTQTIGDRVKRREDPRLITGQALYTPDIPLPDALHLAVVRSPYPHAEIVSIDTEEAAAAPGVVGVFTAADILPTLKKPFPVARAPDGGAFTELHLPPRWALADGKVLTVGDPVVAVVAETAAQAADAAGLVFVDYRDLPGAGDSKAARAEGAELLYPEVAGNRSFVWELHPEGAPEAARGEVEVSLDFRIQRLIPSAMEPRAVAARVDGDRITMWTSTQSAHRVKVERRAHPGHRGGAHPDHRSRGRRRLRRQGEPLRRGGPGPLARPAARPSGPLVRDPHRGLPDHLPRAEPLRDARRFGRPGRAGAALRGGRPLRLGRLLQPARPHHAVAYRRDDRGALRHPLRARPRRGRLHEHRAERALPRLGTPGGHLPDRAGSRRAGRPAGDRSGGNPPPQPDPAAQVPLPDGDRAHLRQRGVRKGARSGARGRRLRGSEGRTGPAARRGREAARHRPRLLRGDLRVRPLGGRRRHHRARRLGHRAERDLPARAGTRDGVGADRRAAARRRLGRRDGAPRRHRRVPAGHRHLRQPERSGRGLGDLQQLRNSARTSAKQLAAQAPRGRHRRTSVSRRGNSSSPAHPPVRSAGPRSRRSPTQPDAPEGAAAELSADVDFKPPGRDLPLRQPPLRRSRSTPTPAR